MHHPSLPILVLIGVYHAVLGCFDHDKLVCLGKMCLDVWVELVWVFIVALMVLTATFVWSATNGKFSQLLGLLGTELQAWYEDIGLELQRGQ